MISYTDKIPGSDGDVCVPSEEDTFNDVQAGRPSPLVYREYGEHATRYETRNFILGDDGDLALTPSTIIVYDVCPWKRFLEGCRRMFVPRGYPLTVSDDYLAFQMWDSVQLFFLTLMGTLSMKVILIGLHFSELEAWINGAAITWILREISSYAVKVYYFTHLIDTLQLGCECKKWRSVSMLVSALSVGVELLLYSTLAHIRLVLCVAMVIRTMANVYDRITNDVIVEHQATSHNLSDVQKKGDRQSTCARIFGIIVGCLLMLKSEWDEDIYIRRVYTTLTICHLYSGYKAIQTLRLRTLNFQRFAVVLRMYLVTGAVYTPKEVNRYDGVIRDKRISVKKLCGYSIKLGASIDPCDIPPCHEMTLLCKAYEGNMYLLCTNIAHRVVYVCLHKDSTPRDEIRAVYHAVMVALATSIVTYTYLPVLDRYPNTTDRYPLQQLRIDVMQCCARVGLLQNCAKCSQYDPVTYVAMVAAELTTYKNFPRLFERLREAGWSTTRHHLRTEGWTAKWTGQYRYEDSDAHLLEFFSKIRISPLNICLHHGENIVYGNSMNITDEEDLAEEGEEL